MKDDTMPIAIVGLSCRLPGGATSPEKLWKMCVEGRDVWQPIPKERMNIGAYYHPDPSRNGTSNVRGGHFLDESPGLFDATFFSLTVAEARAMDPQQRILLELSYEALENGGITLNQVAGSDTAVFVGSSCDDYAHILQRDTEKTELFQSTGLAHTMLSNRISYFYDLRGPSATVDTACSSSLVALHLACNALRLGEAGMAIVGGSNLILSHVPMISLSMLRFLSPDGRCYTYDERANGFGRGEGAACLILKPLENALRDGNTVRAVIRNSGTNQDGRTAGITLPSGGSQIELMERTYRVAGLDPARTSYVEAHGTGTPTGDPIEAASLSKVFARDRPTDQPLKLGSIKSQIGHLEGGSGLAAVVKTVLMLENNLILPNFDFQNANPRIPMRDWRLQVPTRVQPWPIEDVHRASINNFGFGGSNAHVIIDDAQGYMSTRDLTGHYKKPMVHTLMNGDACNGEQEKSRVFVLSSSDELAGKHQAKALGQHLREQSGERSNTFLTDLAYTLGEHRSTLSWKAAFSASSISQLAEAVTDDSLRFAKLPKAQNLGFVFTGQGAQWHAMGRELTDQYPVFRGSLDLAGKYLKGFGASWSVLDELSKCVETSQIGSAFLSQPLTTAIQIALVDLLASWDIRPTRVTGHSSGEIAAAYCAGALTQESALEVAYHRGRLALRLKDFKDGAMLAVGLSKEDALSHIAPLTQGCVKVACVNSPYNVTVSGDKKAILELLAILQEKNVFVREIAVDVAYHSHHMEDVADEYLIALRSISVRSDSTIEFYSSVKGDRVSLSDLGPTYWVSNMVNSVQFLDSAKNLLLSPDTDASRNRDQMSVIDLLVEIGPHSALQAPIKQIIQNHPNLSASGVQYISALVRNTNAAHTCHNLVALLIVNGYSVNLHAVNFPLGSEIKSLLVDLPPHQWNHSSSYWAKAAKWHEHSIKADSRSDIIGVKVKDSNPLEPRWRNVVRLSEIPWIKDHVVQSNVVYPAAGYLAMAIEAEAQHARTRLEHIDGYSLREISIGRALIISQDSENVETMLSLRPYNESLRISSDIWDEFCISSSSDGSPWIENCRGLISAQKTAQVTEVDGGRQAHEESERFRHMVSDYELDCSSVVDTQEMYKALDKIGLSFGPLFSNMPKARASPGRCIAEICTPDTAASMPSHFEYPYFIHPATLDSCLHAIFPINANYSDENQGTPLPTFIGELIVSQSIDTAPGHVFTVCARSKDDNEKVATNGLGKSTNSLAIFDRGLTEDRPKIVINDLVMTSLAKDVPGERNRKERKVSYQTVWQPDPDYLTSEQATAITASFRKPYPDADQDRMAQQAAFYYAERAIDQISAKEVATLQPHHGKLYRCLTGFCQAVRDGQLGIFPTDDWLLDSAQRASVCAQVGQTPYGILLCHVGENLSGILRKYIDPLSLMMEGGRLERYYRTFEPLHQASQQAAVYVKLLGNKNPHLNILEIGAGTGSVSYPMLEALSDDAEGAPPNFANYDFTDLSPAFFEKAREKLSRWREYVKFKKLDIDCDPFEQGYIPGSYDLIIAANVVHATSRVEETMKRVNSLLKPGGTLLLMEMTVQAIASTLVFGTLPGWWIGKEESRQTGPLMVDEEWRDILYATGFTGMSTVLWDMPDPASHLASIIISAKPVEDKKALPTITIVTEVESQEPCLDHLKDLLAGAGVQHNTATLNEFEPKDQVCIVLCELTRSVLRGPSPSEYDALKHIFLESGGVVWVTRGALIEPSEPDLQLVNGLARTIRVEKGDTMVVTLDLDGRNLLSGVQMAEKIFAILKTNFGKEYANATHVETEYVERNGTIMIPRITEDKDLTSFVTKVTGPSIVEQQPYYQAGRFLKAAIQTPGLLDSIHFVDDDSISGGLPDQFVEVDVKASGINFRDVMSALGQIDTYPLGVECCGVVTAVGNGVYNLKAGDHVVANVKCGCFCNTIRAPAEELELVPQNIPFEVAAALSVAYFTAYWAVFKVARLRKDETVLIHAGSGGLGQAIINLCHLIGVEIFATVGTIEKKHLLMAEYHIPEDHIFSSRDGTFFKGVINMTEGRGVDVVMNSLSGEALRLSWECIAPFGRFVELGKRDFTINTRLEMRHFEKNVSFMGLDVPINSRLAEKKQIWSEIVILYEKGSIKAARPITVYGISELEKALRTMQSGKHMGKLVLLPRPDEMVKVVASKTNPHLLRGDASYLLIGGLGGIGRATAFWMLKHGARNFIFASPSGSEKPKSKEAIKLLENQGARVAAFSCDISKIADLDQVLEHCKRDMPPIRGMIHAALVLKADLFGNLSLQDYNDIMKPKVDGVWNLHDRLSKTDLDFFILLSSVVGVVGDPSQAAYNAASVFQENFANYRNHQGLPAVTLALGKIVDIGIVAEKLSARRGVQGLWSRDVREEEVMAMIESAIITPLRKHGSGSSITGLRKWSPTAGAIFQTPIFSHFRRAAMGRSQKSDRGESTAPRIRESLRQAQSLEDAVQRTCDALSTKTATLLMIALEEMSPSKSMSEYGMDSLVAVEMRNWLLRELDAAMPILELMANISLHQLSMKIVRKSKLVDPAILKEGDT